MQGPRSVSAEHDYLVEQIEELKRRLLERNREYESLRRRERRLHNDVFERDERIQQVTLTMTDLEAALQDRTAELRELEEQRSSMEHELHSARRSERTREVVGRVFADSLSLVRSHESRELKRELYANAPDVERTIKAPTAEDMVKLAEGEEVALDTEETELEPGMDVDGPRPAIAGRHGRPRCHGRRRLKSSTARLDKTGQTRDRSSSSDEASSVTVLVTIHFAPAFTAVRTSSGDRNPPPTRRVSPSTEAAFAINSG